MAAGGGCPSPACGENQDRTEGPRASELPSYVTPGPAPLLPPALHSELPAQERLCSGFAALTGPNTGTC